MNNYQLSRDRACQYFLRFDQQKIIDGWHLKSDADWIYTELLGTEYRVNRHSGAVEQLPEGTQADYSRTLTVFDLLCHEGADKFPARQYAPVNSLKGAGGTIGVELGSKTADFFAASPEIFCRACEKLGGVPEKIGDIGYRFKVFDELELLLRLYFSDDEFPADITALWDTNALNYMFYETSFYAVGVLYDMIGSTMRRLIGAEAGGRE